jgi:hypothetical protein
VRFLRLIPFASLIFNLFEKRDMSLPLPPPTSSHQPTANIIPSVAIHAETWIQKNWRPTAAFVYLFICLFDFVVMPFLTFLWHQPLRLTLTQIANFSPDVQKEILDKTVVFWTPITIAGMAILHVSFGGILGISAWGRSSEKVEQYKQAAETQRVMVNRDCPSPTNPCLPTEIPDRPSQPDISDH